MKRKLLPIILILLITTLILFISFYDYIFQYWPFIPYYDMRTQYRQYFAEFERLIKNAIEYKTLPFWSWNFFLGNNFWASKSYQLLGDIFAYVALLIKTHVYNRVLIVTLLKYIISSLTFFIYLSNRSKSTMIRLIGALAYAFSSYILRFTEQPFFMTFYALIPIYLIGVERIIAKKRPYLFILIVSLLLVTNYYLFYTLTIFSLLYFIFRSIELKQDLKTFILKLSTFISYYLVGVGMTMFIILPSFYSIIGNPRIGNLNFNFWSYPELTNYFNVLMSYVLPMQSTLGGLFVSHYYNLESYIWTGSLIALLLPQVFLGKNENKISYRVLFGVFFTILIFPVGSSILHGFSEPSLRWQFMIVIFSIIATLPFIENPDRINKKLLYITGSVYVVLIFSMYFIYIYLFPQEVSLDFNQIKIFAVYALVYGTFILLLSGTLKLKTWYPVILVALVVFEYTFTTYIAFNRPSAKSFSWDTINKVETVLGGNRELQEYLLSLDSEEEFYRVYVPYESVYWVFSLNMNLIYDFMDSKTYDTTYQTSNNDLFKMIRNENFYNWFVELKDPEILDFVGTKYALVRSSDELPHQNYELIDIYNYLEVYRNLNYRGVFKSYDKVMSYGDFDQIKDTALINTYVIANEDKVDSIRKNIGQTFEPLDIKVAQKYPNMLLARSNNQNQVFVVSNIPYDTGWQVTINDIEVETYSTNGGFISFSIPSGGGDIKMYFMPSGFKIGVTISVLFVILFGLFIGFNEFKLWKSKPKA